MRAPRLAVVATLVIAAALAPLAASAQEWEKVEIVASPLGDGLYMLDGIGGNVVASVGEDGALLVDDQFPQVFDRLRASVPKLKDAPLRFVVNTNWHFDHASANEVAARSGAVIIAHDNSRTHMMADERIPEYDPRIVVPAYPKAALPVVTVADGLTLHFNGEDIQVRHVANAHSDGDVLVRFPNANVVHTGDVFFSGGFPFIHVSGGGTIDGMIAGADAILALCDAETKVVPGHGALSNRDGVKAYRAMLVVAKDRVLRLVNEGKTLEQVLAAKPLAELGPEWKAGVPAEMFATVVYMDLTKKPALVS